MEITETTKDGLKRTLKVVVPKAELGTRFSARLVELRDRVQLKGFRKGKVPEVHLKKVYGKSVMAEVLEETVKETSLQVLKDRNEKAAAQPKIELADDAAQIDQVMSGDADLAYSMSFEVLPPIPVADLSALKLERLVADVDDESLNKAIDELAARSVTYTPEEGRAAGDGDRLQIDFKGTIDGVAFEGGTGTGMHLVLGKGNFIPGFEDGLKGIKAGEQRNVSATFPADYVNKELAGKDAVFDITATEVAAQVKAEIDDEFAKSLGANDIAHLKELVTAQLTREYEGASRMKIKREMLDALDKAHDFELPASLVDFEFDNIWRQLTEGLKSQGKTFEDEGKTEDDARTEYRDIAARRVRLGLVMGEIGDKNKITITQDELRRALIEAARRYPGQEKMVYEYYEKTPGAMAELRAPIFEDKVVDYILEQAKPAERKVTKDELFKAVEETTEA